MNVTVTTTIEASAQNIWNTIRSYDNVERFLPIVTSSTITGTDEGSERVCQVQLGDQQAELVEKLDSVDEENKTIKFSITRAPSPFGGLQVSYQVKSLGKNKAKVLISTEVDDGNEQAAKGMQDIFQMAAGGLKKLHEKEVNQ